MAKSSRRLVRRGFGLMLVVAVLAAGAGALVYFFYPQPKYTGRIVYLVSNRSTGQLTPGVWDDRDPEQYRAFQVNVLTSRLVLNAALAEPGVAALPMFEKDKSLDAIQYLQGHLKVDFNNGAEHMRLSLEGDDPGQLKQVLTAINRAYTTEVTQKEMTRRRGKMNSLQHLRDTQDDRIKKLNSQIRGILTVGSTDPILIDIERRRVERQLNESDAEMLKLNRQERELVFLMKRAGEEKNQTAPEVERDDLKKQLELIRDQKMAASKDLSEAVAKLNALNASVAATASLELEKKNAETIAAKVNDELVRMETEMDAQTRVCLWEDAYVAPGVDDDRRPRYAAWTAGGVLALGSVLVALLLLIQWLTAGSGPELTASEPFSTASERAETGGTSEKMANPPGN